ncbi:helix-turn-helix domain-containing protein [Actinomadura oligospora]|uniref:helix-turn-helix domain-containing protein n=1 Tax=Actinomadura oligospora TaxID=111804 RepID=UPI00047DF029|nr:helix-turn-helix transcriptional regulator [Actinomadura oligospora]
MSVAESLDPYDSLWHATAVYLRKERKRRKLTLEQVAQIIGADRQRVGNYEANRLQITKEHAEMLDGTWDTDFSVMRHFAVLFGNEQDWVKELWDYERGALVIKAYVAHFIPVPLQTEAYARAVIEKIRIADNVEAAVRNRMTRTKNLLEQNTSLWVLIDEEALEMEWIESDEVKKEQLQALLDLSERFSVRVVEHRQRTHVGTDGNFELIVTDTGRDVAYVWAQIGGKVVHVSDQVRDLSLRWDRMGAKALTEDSTRELIRQKLERLK